MESLIRLTKRNIANNKMLKQMIQVPQLENVFLKMINTSGKDLLRSDVLSICDFSKLTDSEYLNLFTISSMTDENAIDIFINLTVPQSATSTTPLCATPLCATPLSATPLCTTPFSVTPLCVTRIPLGETLSIEEYETIKFDQFNDNVQQQMLNIMLKNNISIVAMICLLDEIRSVNYGKELDNPLIYCCHNNRLDMVKLLVEIYGADIEYSFKNDKTAIMYATEKNHLDIVKYLYEKGAKLETRTHIITNDTCRYGIFDIIKTWDTNKHSKDELQTKYNALQSDYVVLRERYDSILKLCSSI